MLHWLERHFDRFAIPHLTLVLVLGQSLFFFVGLVQPEILNELELQPKKVLDGEVWRLVLFLWMPPRLSPIFAFFALYLLYLFGTALENEWGIFRFNVYVLIAYLATISVVWIAPTEVATNSFITGSIFLAFAFLYPDFVLHIFFIFPVKVKWIALITWIGYGFAFLNGTWLTRVLVLASVMNFLLFFGSEIMARIKRGRRRIKQQAQQTKEESEPFHRCVICDKTDLSDPQLEFRYCPQCTGGQGYCPDHIFEHEHR